MTNLIFNEVISVTDVQIETKIKTNKRNSTTSLWVFIDGPTVVWDFSPYLIYTVDGLRVPSDFRMVCESWNHRPNEKNTRVKNYPFTSVSYKDPVIRSSVTRFLPGNVSKH